MGTEELDLPTPLPYGHGPEPVNQNNRGFLGGLVHGFRVRTPEMDGGLFINVNCLLRETGGGEAATEVAAVKGNDAEEGW